MADRLALEGRCAGPLLDGSERTTELIIGERKLRPFLQEIRELRLRCGQQDDLTTDPEYFITANAIRFRRLATVLIRRDREWNEQAARKQLLKFFEAMGPTDPLTVSARRRLSSILFS